VWRCEARWEVGLRQVSLHWSSHRSSFPPPCHVWKSSVNAFAHVEGWVNLELTHNLAMCRIPSESAIRAACCHDGFVKSRIIATFYQMSGAHGAQGSEWYTYKVGRAGRRWQPVMELV